MYDSYAYPIIVPPSFSEEQDRYLLQTGQKNYALPSSVLPIEQPESKIDSIESILEQDANALLDKVVTTAFSIVYRIKIYNDIQKSMEYQQLKTSSQLRQLYDWPPGNTNLERRKSMLTKEMHALERNRLESKVEAWKDLTEPVNNLVSFWHESKAQKTDKEFFR